MEPPQRRKKREASLKKKDKGHVYSAKHARLQGKMQSDGFLKHPQHTKSVPAHPSL